MDPPVQGGSCDGGDVGDIPSEPPRDGWLLYRIHVPELNVHKCLQFPADQLVWDVKQQCLAALPKELKECFNYGLFCPPANGKAGKFLDEERRLGDYPFAGPVGYLELKYKRRVYKMLKLDERQLKALHTRSNLRRFLEYITNGQVEKVAKMCSKGLDPNFHCQETGETPLTLGTTIKQPARVLIALVNGGALLDYRTREGTTALHRAVEKDCREAVSTLLELGASPNYKDGRGLTPLYLSVTNKTNPLLCADLLHDHATLGAQDLQGWQEVHQACRNGLVQHLEHLVFYGADMDARNASGNTPLHVCAVNAQEACARMLLFRGAQRAALNFSNQTAYQVAVIAGNLELAEIIRSYRGEDVVPFRGPPRYNPRRRSGLGGMGTWGAPPLSRGGPRNPSPSPSDRPFSSASSSLSDGSHGSSSHRSHEDDASIVTDKSLGDSSDIISDSSGVGTGSDTTGCPPTLSRGTTVVCLEPYAGGPPGHIRIERGDVLEVTGSTDCGLLEGSTRDESRVGLFPSHCVQEVRLRQGGTNTEQQQRPHTTHYSATAPRVKKTASTDPRNVVLHRARRGFGFVLRGAKASSPLMALRPSERFPALQYLDDVDPGGVADLAGLHPGDYLLAINGEDVTAASHEHVVQLIRGSGTLVQMTVISQSIIPPSQGGPPSAPPVGRQYATLPRKMSSGGTLGRSPAPMPPRRDPKTTLSVGRARAKSMVAGLENGGEKDDNEDVPSTTKSSSAESIHQNLGNNVAPSSGDPGTPVQPRTASIRARPMSSRITAAELEELFQRQQGSSAGGNRGSTMMSSSRFQSSEVGTLSPPGSPAKPRVYTSVAEMKRKGKSSIRARPVDTPRISSDLHRDFHSTPDLAHGCNGGLWGTWAGRGHRSQEDVHSVLNSIAPSRSALPPPTHPPPPPPIGQVVKVDVSRGTPSEYDNMAAVAAKAGVEAVQVDNESIMSSFRPAANAKLYASPQDVRAVGYRSKNDPNARQQVRKSQSMRGSTPAFKPTSTSTLLSNQRSKATVNDPHNNPYAQPIRSHPSKFQQNRQDGKEGVAPPPIPEPDYSMSESEEEGESKTPCVRFGKLNPDETLSDDEIIPRASLVNNMTVAETSGNSNTSGSSTGSGSMAHSFSVDEIQKIRTHLKSSKSYPNDFVGHHRIAHEEGDNSSSGVSSDQDVPCDAVKDKAVDILDSASKSNSPIIESCNGGTSPLSPPSRPLQRHNSLTRKQAAAIALNRAKAQGQSAAERLGISADCNPTRKRPIFIGSLAQLPPPIEAESEECTERVLPPPPEFIGSANNNVPVAGEEVLAPPPQFSDKMGLLGGARVRIVGAVPKSGGKLHGQ